MSRGLKELWMRRAPGKDQTMDRTDEGETIEASGDAIVIAGAIHDLADAIRQHARAMSGEEPTEESQYDLSGNPL
jgi:hypothetical protein